MKWFVGLMCSILVVGCAADPVYTKLQPGAELVRVTSNPNDVVGMEHVGYYQTYLGEAHPQQEYANNFARNFAVDRGGDVALIKTSFETSNGYRTMYIDVNAYRSKKK